MKHALHHIHFTGIGGAGMSAIAEILHRQGFCVSGSDQSASEVTQRLAELGITVFIGHHAAHIEGAQAVVASTAVQADNPELRAAHARRVPVVPRAEMLAELMRHKLGVAIAGTHGKTTTTSLTASVLVEAGLDPSYVIGGQLLTACATSQSTADASSQSAAGESSQSAAGATSQSAAGAGAASGGHLGQGEHMVVEADESDASFLRLSPVLAVVTNIDADHMATYGHELGRLHTAFVEFIHRLPFYGRAVVCADDPGVLAVLPRLQRPLTTYGLNAGADLRAVDVQALPGGQMRFVAVQAGHLDLALTLNLAGLHNVCNALAAIAVAREFGVADAPITAALARFAGVGRRFQRHGEMAVPAAQGGGHFTLVDDYGHHPVELAAVLTAAHGAFPGRRLVLAFQPHRYTRTRDCFSDFVAVLGRFDAVLLSEVYAAGEAALPGADGRTLAAAVAGAAFVAAVDELPAAILTLVRDGDVLITMGAGSIGAVPQRLLVLAGTAAGVGEGMAAGMAVAEENPR